MLSNDSGVWQMCGLPESGSCVVWRICGMLSNDGCGVWQTMFVTKW